MGKPFDADLKALFLAAVKIHLAKGWSITSAYQQAKAEFQQEGKPVPDRAVVYLWLRQEGAFPRTRRTGRTGRTGRTNAGTEAAEPETEDPEAEGTEAAGEAAEVEAANLSDGSDGSDSAKPTGPGEPEPEGPEGQPGESPELDDYTRRLEMMVRLYRTRSEADVDAVCDYLLPDLCAEEE